MNPSQMVLQVVLPIKGRPANQTLERPWIDMDGGEMTDQLSLAIEGTVVPTVFPFASEQSVGILSS